MVKIAITSDLHLGITQASTIRELVHMIAAAKPALTVLAGDIGEGLPRFVECLDLFAQSVMPRRALIPTNHVTQLVCCCMASCSRLYFRL